MPLPEFVLFERSSSGIVVFQNSKMAVSAFIAFYRFSSISVRVLRRHYLFAPFLLFLCFCFSLSFPSTASSFSLLCFPESLRVFFWGFLCAVASFSLFRSSSSSFLSSRFVPVFIFFVHICFCFCVALCLFLFLYAWVAPKRGAAIALLFVYGGALFVLWYFLFRVAAFSSWGFCFLFC